MWKGILIILVGMSCWLFILSLFIWDFNRQNSKVAVRQNSIMSTKAAEQRFLPIKNLIFEGEVESGELETYEGDSAETNPEKD